jgi:hypothetical protein
LRTLALVPDQLEHCDPASSEFPLVVAAVMAPPVRAAPELLSSPSENGRNSHEKQLFDPGRVLLLTHFQPGLCRCSGRQYQLQIR